MDYRNVTIETERLLLVPISSEFRTDIFESFTEGVSRYTYPQPTGNITDTDTFISESFQSMIRGEQLQFVAVLKENDEFIACCGLHHLATKPELGLWIKEFAWGLGFGFETMKGIKNWARKNIKYEYLYYPVKKDNVGSRRIAEKLGGILESEEFLSQNARGEEYTMVAYRIA